MKKRIALIGLLALIAQLGAQEFSPVQDKQNQKRWEWHQPAAEIYLKGGDTLTGQPVHFDMETLWVFPSRSFPLNLEDRLLEVDLEDIEGIYIDRGGRLTLAQTSGIVLGIGVGTIVGLNIGGPLLALLGGNALGVTFGLSGKGLHNAMTRDLLMLIPGHEDYPGELQKLHRWSVFPDSLVFTGDIRQLPEHSMAARRAFPQKHFRVSASLNAGFGILQDQFREGIAGSGLPNPEYDSYTTLGHSFLDLSWRFRNRLIIGWEWMRSSNDLAHAGYYFYDPDDPGNQENYTYSIGLQEFRFYADWVFMPIDRFFTRRMEVTAGMGFIYSLPEAYFYAYREIQSDPWISEHAEMGETNDPLGIQVRGAAHFYAFRNLSLSAGMELNLYQDLEIPDVYYPSGELTNSAPILRSHTLNYSSLRFRVGAHLYF